MTKAFEYTPEMVTELPANHIFVFGSNTDGKHGAGSAATALRYFGALMHVPMGLQGQSYAIITKDFKQFNPANAQYVSNMVAFINSQIVALYDYATFKSDWVFVVTKIGTGLSGLPFQEICELFYANEVWRPANIILPKEFDKNFGR